MVSAGGEEGGTISLADAPSPWIVQCSTVSVHKEELIKFLNMSASGLRKMRKLKNYNITIAATQRPHPHCEPETDQCGQEISKPQFILGGCMRCLTALVQTVTADVTPP